MDGLLLYLLLLGAGGSLATYTREVSYHEEVLVKW
jgi:hypothetical protein